MCCAAFAWRDAANQQRPICDRLLRMEGCGLARETLRDDFSIFVDQDRHEERS